MNRERERAASAASAATVGFACLAMLVSYLQWVTDAFAVALGATVLSTPAPVPTRSARSTPPLPYWPSFSRPPPWRPPSAAHPRCPFDHPDNHPGKDRMMEIN